MKGERVEFDRAYVCFLICGLAALLGVLMEVIPKDEGTTALLGFFVAIPLVLVAVIALVAGVVSWILLPKRWPLSALAVMSVLYIAALAAGRGLIVISIAYGAAVVAICGAWFLIFRNS